MVSTLAQSTLGFFNDKIPQETTTTVPSAVSVFSNLIPTSPLSMPTVGLPTQPSPTGPHALPTEILSMIFHSIFESCVASPTDDANLASWLDEDPLSPSLFPYAPACVCRRWYEILKPIPIYWTRVVIALDDIAASLTAAPTTLGWAGTAPLKIVVTRHRDTSETRNSERFGVNRVMALLRPHISHIWSLSFDVEHSSAIPALWRESGRAQHLKVLTLLSRSDAGHQLIWLPSRELVVTLDVPLLQDVTLSGHFLKDPVTAHPRFASWFRHMTSLTVCGNAAFVMSLYKFLSMINNFPAIQELTVEDMHFNNTCPMAFELRPAVFCFRRVTGRVSLQSMLMCTHSASRSRTDVTIVDCAMRGFSRHSDFQFTCTSLTLASMDPRAEIEEFVCRWNGERLSVIDCPQVSRSFLEQLSEDTATLLSHLDIVDCVNVHAADVVALVQSRETQAASASLMDVSDEDAFTALAALHVRGRGPAISAKRAEWLAEHVERFSWDTVAKDGVRYVWDGSSGQLMMSPAPGGRLEVA